MTLKIQITYWVCEPALQCVVNTLPHSHTSKFIHLLAATKKEKKAENSFCLNYVQHVSKTIEEPGNFLSQRIYYYSALISHRIKKNLLETVTWLDFYFQIVSHSFRARRRKKKVKHIAYQYFNRAPPSAVLVFFGFRAHHTIYCAESVHGISFLLKRIEGNIGLKRDIDLFVE